MTDGRAPVRLRAEDLAWRETGGEVVALDLASSVYFGLNRTGAVLWQRLAGAGATPDELAAELVERGGQPSTAPYEVASFLGELDRAGLLA